MAQRLHALALDGELSIYRAAELKPLLLAAVATEADVIELDLAQVAEIDTAGVQLLLLAKREALARGRALRLVNHSACVVDAIELLDLAGHFGDPIVVAA